MGLPIPGVRAPCTQHCPLASRMRDTQTSQPGSPPPSPHHLLHSVSSIPRACARAPHHPDPPVAPLPPLRSLTKVRAIHGRAEGIGRPAKDTGQLLQVRLPPARLRMGGHGPCSHESWRLTGTVRHSSSGAHVLEGRGRGGHRIKQCGPHSSLHQSREGPAVLCKQRGHHLCFQPARGGWAPPPTPPPPHPHRKSRPASARAEGEGGHPNLAPCPTQCSRALPGSHNAPPTSTCAQFHSGAMQPGGLVARQGSGSQHWQPLHTFHSMSV